MTMWPGAVRCVVCERGSADMMLVQVIETGSGPGRGQYACPSPCAQQYAKRLYAPDWLREDLYARGLWP
ncbi:hypothetical protein ACWGJ2_14985 [Streptomyces sp. NPDC054796]